MFCANISHYCGGYQSCQMVWCVSCYLKVILNIFQVNDTMDEDDNLLYDYKSDDSRYKVGTYGAHLMGPFQYDLCVFCTLYDRNPRRFRADEDKNTIIIRINLDAILSIEPSTMANNLRKTSLFISTCETNGFDTQFPILEPFPFADMLGYTAVLSMLSHYIRPGVHSFNYTQFVKTRKQCSAYRNACLASQ